MAKKAAADPNQTNMFVSDTRPHAYTVLIHPGFQISEKVRQLKHHLNSFVPISESDLNSKPHITLCYKVKSYNADDLIVNQVHEAIKGITSFDIKVDGFDFRDDGTFLLKLKDQGPIYKLILALQQQLNVSQGETPHITIARSLKKKALDILPLEDFEYEPSFKCNSLTILKQVLDPEEKTEVLLKIKFPG